MKSKAPKWIVLKYDVQPPLFKCERCQETRELHLPAPISDFVKQSQAFGESHKYCKEVKP